MIEQDTAAQLRLTVTHHHNLYVPTQWTAEQTTWGAFVEQRLAAGHRQDIIKENAPLISLYELCPGGKRCNSDVVSIGGVQLDFDDKTLDQVMQCVLALQNEGIACLCSTTWKHCPPEHERWRVIVPLAQVIAPSQFNSLLEYVWAHFAEHADRDADGLSRGFFVPSVHPERADLASIFYLPGCGMPVHLVSVPAPSPAPAPAAVRIIQHETWTLLFKRWRGSTKSNLIDLGNRGASALLGMPIAQPGERDTVLWDFVCGIVRAYPDVSADAVWELLRHSIERAAADYPQDCLTEHDVREKLERARVAHLADSDASMPFDRKSAIKQAFGSNRDTQYTADELANIREMTGLSATQLDKAWILQHETDYYILGPLGKLYTAGREALLNTCRVALAPAPVELYCVDKAGRRLKTAPELLEAHSLPLAEVRRSLVTSKPIFDLPARKITLPSCPKRPLVARYSAEIDEWLVALAGVRYLDLIKWIAHVPDLSRPLTGLVLTGRKSVGKSLLANGLARLWVTSGPSKLSEAMGGFNSTLERCPFCHADEADIPKDSRGVERTGELREFVQSTSRLINEKFRRQVPLDGAARLQISANNENVFSLHADLTDHDLDAIAERFTHIKCLPMAAEYLEAIGGREGVEPWIEGDALPAHALWLAEQHGSVWAGRFGVESSGGGDLADTLAVRGGVRSKVCELCVRALSNTEPLGDGCFISGREMIVHLDWVLRMWELILGKGRVPPTSAVIQALEGLGERLESSDGLIYFVLSPSKLEAWALESGFGTSARVGNWLVHHGN
ncbi:MAG: primase-helicase family protein [Dehalococcoidia bacterium]|jgi:hypothetical protein